MPWHTRHSVRKADHDYGAGGRYFVTICTAERGLVFGQVADGEVQLNAVGEIALACWNAIPSHFPHVSLDESIIMPDHLHGVIDVGVRATHASPLRRMAAGSLGAIVGSYKAAVTKRVNEMRGTPGPCYGSVVFTNTSSAMRRI